MNRLEIEGLENPDDGYLVIKVNPDHIENSVAVYRAPKYFMELVTEDTTFNHSLDTLEDAAITATAEYLKHRLFIHKRKLLVEDGGVMVVGTNLGEDA